MPNQTTLVSLTALTLPVFVLGVTTAITGTSHTSIRGLFSGLAHQAKDAANPNKPITTTTNTVPHGALPTEHLHAIESHTWDLARRDAALYAGVLVPLVLVADARLATGLIRGGWFGLGATGRKLLEAAIVGVVASRTLATFSHLTGRSLPSITAFARTFGDLGTYTFGAILAILPLWY
ncbi:hypothetical protein DFS34DRAFT_625063 [Phlyctochytrium arcticum]|nr:hypothetical protein DFS34DRAFT_625063 [Phlyctochytrium arcticum]